MAHSDLDPGGHGVGSVSRRSRVAAEDSLTGERQGRSCCPQHDHALPRGSATAAAMAVSSHNHASLESFPDLGFSSGGGDGDL